MDEEKNSLDVDEIKTFFYILGNPNKYKNPNQVAIACKSSKPQRVYEAIKKFKPFLNEVDGYSINIETLEKNYDGVFPADKKKDFLDMIKHPFLVTIITANIDFIVDLFKSKPRQKTLIDIQRKMTYKADDVENLKKVFRL